MPEKGPLEPPASTAVPRSPGGSGNGAPEAQHERRVLTALCYDLVGSTDLLGLLDIEDYQDLIAAFQQAARQAISSCSGVVKLEAGDGGVALFPAEIDAKDAPRWPFAPDWKSSTPATASASRKAARTCMSASASRRR